MIDEFTTRQVCILTGVSERQLLYWVATDLIRPSVHRAFGSGDRHVFSDVDVRLVALLVAASPAGNRFGSHTSDCTRIRRLIIQAFGETPHAEWFVILDGKTVVACTNADEVVAATHIAAVSTVIRAAASASSERSTNTGTPAGDGRHRSAAVPAALASP